MKPIAIIVLICGLIAIAPVLYGQSELEEFPRGTTYMVYTIMTDGVAEPQLLALTVTGLEDGRYRVKMTTEAIGTPDEVSVFGFLLGMTGVRSGGSNVSYDALGALISHRKALGVGGEPYVLAGGRTFSADAEVEIASVRCLQGTFSDPEEPDTRMTIAFSLSEPVFIAPLIHEEHKQGEEWVVTFSLELTEYTVTPPES